MVDEVVRRHQAVVYEIKTAAAPETQIAKSSTFLDSGGLKEKTRNRKEVSTPYSPNVRRDDLQVCCEALLTPVLECSGKEDKDRNGEKVVVHHSVPVYQENGVLSVLSRATRVSAGRTSKVGDLDSLAHGQDIPCRYDTVHLRRGMLKDYSTISRVQR